MSSEQISKLKDRIFRGEKQLSSVEAIMDFIRETGALSDILGRDFEVYNPSGELIYRIRQKPITIPKLNILLKALEALRERERKEVEKSKHRGKR